MITGYTLGISVGHPVEIFEAPEDYSIERLLEALKVERGTGGEPFQPGGPRVRQGKDLFPSDLLIVSEVGEVRVVGALASPWTDNHDFAIYVFETALVTRARSFARHLMQIDPCCSAQIDRYHRDASQRFVNRSS